MSLAGWWRNWWDADVAGVLSKAEAVERVRRYAEMNNIGVDEPIDGHIETHWIDGRDPSKGKRRVYVMGLGDHRPMTVVEVDATDGTVIAWRTFPR